MTVDRKPEAEEEIQTVCDMAKEALEVEGVTEATVEHNGIKVTLSKKVTFKEE
jgi:hypothetical protein